MKVNHSNSGVTSQTGSTQTSSEVSKNRGKGHHGKTENAGNDGGDKVQISNKARDIAKAKTIAKSSPDTDEAKIAKLKEAIQSGNYKINADAIADKLVDEHLATL